MANGITLSCFTYDFRIKIISISIQGSHANFFFDYPKMI